MTIISLDSLSNCQIADCELLLAKSAVHYKKGADFFVDTFNVNGIFCAKQ